MRRAAECCDSLQSFFFMHSLGGGTGSGLGSYVLQMVEDAFPEVYRFTTAVFPSKDDDVITSPYNRWLRARVHCLVCCTHLCRGVRMLRGGLICPFLVFACVCFSLLCASKLIEHADCVLPIENQALLDLVALAPPPAAAPAPAPSLTAVTSSQKCHRVSAAIAQLAKPKGVAAPAAAKIVKSRPSSTGPGSSAASASASAPSSSAFLTAEPVRFQAPRARPLSEQNSRAFDDMNTIGAHLLTNLTW